MKNAGSEPSPSQTKSPLLLEMRGITKHFPGVKALRGVNLELQKGEVLAVLGENGAGKSTLMKVLGGGLHADEGALHINGREHRFRSPEDSRSAGIAVIYQEFNLIPGLSVVENIFLGQEKTHFGFLEPSLEGQKAAALFRRLGINIDLSMPCRDLSTAQQQLVEIAKALAFNAQIIVMDEPSAALSSHEVERLFKIIRELKNDGIGVIYISHRLNEIFSICDRVAFLRDGANAGGKPVSSLSRAEMIRSMVGRTLSDEYPKRSTVPSAPVLEVRRLSRGSTVRDVSFKLRKGEILALTGLVGAGRTETARLIFGADIMDSGEIWMNGEKQSLRDPRDAIAAGIGFLTEDRKNQGLILSHSVRANFGLPNLDRLSDAGFVNDSKERLMLASYTASLQIKTPGPEEPAGHLSGGNQQKVVLAKWLARQCEVLIFDEPTRGVDVGAKFEIYQLLNALAAEGKAVLMISSELPEVLGMADRILVMHAGRITGEISDARLASEEQIMQLAVA